MLDDCTTIEFPRDGVTGLGFDFELGLLYCRAAGPGGYPLHVLVDTGTDPSAVDLRLARRLALRTGGSGLGHGAASDAVEFTEAVLPWLRFGDLTIRNLFAPALDLSGLPFQVDVVLGYNVLRQVSLQIDYRRRWLMFAHPDLSLQQISPGSAVLPLDFFEHFPALRNLEVDGCSIPLATLDTGSNSALTVGPDLAATLGLLRGAGGVASAYGSGFGGSSEVLYRPCRELHLGPFTFPNVDLDAHLGDAGDLSRRGRANIGNRLLARFVRVTLDYERAILGLEAES